MEAFFGGGKTGGVEGEGSEHCGEDGGVGMGDGERGVGWLGLRRGRGMLLGMRKGRGMILWW